MTSKIDMQDIQKEIRQICTYHSELGEGTAGYSLSEEQFIKLFALIKKHEREVLEGIRKELYDLNFRPIRGTQNYAIRNAMWERFAWMIDRRLQDLAKLKDPNGPKEVEK